MSTIGGLPRAFTKMSGAGNDFLVFSGRVEVGPREMETIRRLCRRGTGVGADGVLFVYPDERSEGRIVADYRNSDGGSAKFCANGTRCAARFASLRGMCAASLAVMTGWGEIGATIRADGKVTLRLPEPISLGERIDTGLARNGLIEDSGSFLTVGVPQLVVFAEPGVGIDAIDVERFGPPLRHHPSLPEGANVNFVTRDGATRISVRAYERGVEGETLSCGTGAVASAIVTAVRFSESGPVSVSTRSGSILSVGFRLVGELATEVTLTGEARVVFEGFLSAEAC